MRVSVSLAVIASALLVFAAMTSADDAAICFCREEVSITLDPEGVLFESIYCFENRSADPCSQSMFYEFPLDSVHLYPDTICVAYGYLDLDYQKAEGGILFEIQMPGGSCATVRVDFRQVCLDPCFCYTPKTMRAWNEPIEEADFEIRVPSGLELESISYQMHEITKDQAFTVHRFTCKNCLPSEDLCLRWSAQR